MLLLLVGLACLFPVSLYCLFLALLHHRRHPTMVSGPWDFTGVLLALFGFMLIGGTTLVFALHGAARDFWMRGDNFADLRRSHASAGMVTFLIWGIYFLLIVGGALYWLRQRAAYTILYNLAPLELESIFSALFDRLGLTHMRRGTRLYVGYGPPVKSATALQFGGDDGLDPAAPAIDPVRKALIDVDGSSAMRVVSLRWHFASRELRRELEAELARDLERFETGPGPASGWFITAAGCIMLLMIFFLATFLIQTLWR